MDIVNDSTGYAASMAGLLPTGMSGLPSNASLQGALQSFNPSGGSLTFGSGVSMLSQIGSIGGSLAVNIDDGGSATTTTTEGIKNQLQALQAQLQQSQLKLLQAVKTNQYHEMKKSKQLLDNQKQKDEPTAAFSSDSSQKRKVEAMNGTGIDESSSKRLRTDDTDDVIPTSEPQTTSRQEQAQRNGIFPNLSLS